MALSQMNLSTVLLVVALLPVVMAARGMYACTCMNYMMQAAMSFDLINIFAKSCLMRLRNHTESASIGKYTCAEHPSSNYKGICIAIIDDDAYNRVCLEESSKNYNGFCHYYACWCQGVCTSETETQAVASVPIRQ